MKVCIIGGGGGASNAANVIRSLDKQAEIVIFTNRGEIGNLPCEIPFVIKGDIPSWESSFAFKEKFYKERNIEVYLNTEVTEIARQEKRLTAGGESYSYDKLILDLGSTPVIPPISGLDGHNEFVLSTGIGVAKIFEDAIPKHSNSAIIGVGQIALEVATLLKTRSYRPIYLVGRSDHMLRAYLDKDMAEMVEDRVRESGIDLILSSKIARVATTGKGKIVSLLDRELEVEIVFFATAAEPNIELAQKAGLKIGETGAIAVNEYLQTSDPDIYAIGDCIENRERITGTKMLYQTATNAARTGRIAGRNLVLGNIVCHSGTVLPFITEVFGYQVGTVGFTEAYARERGLDIVCNTTRTSTRRRLFGGKPMHIKLIADSKKHTLVGVQIVGEELVAGKVDKLAVAIAEKIPIERLSLIDTCYSPTTGAGYEAVTMALDELTEKLS